MTSTFPGHPAFAGLRSHFEALADAGDFAGVAKQARAQAVELKRQWRVASGRRPSSQPAKRDYDTIIGRMTSGKVDAADLLALISWLDTAASAQPALHSLSASLVDIASRRDLSDMLAEAGEEDADRRAA